MIMCFSSNESWRRGQTPFEKILTKTDYSLREKTITLKIVTKTMTMTKTKTVKTFFHLTIKIDTRHIIHKVGKNFPLLVLPDFLIILMLSVQWWILPELTQSRLKVHLRMWMYTFIHIHFYPFYSIVYVHTNIIVYCLLDNIFITSILTENAFFSNWPASIYKAAPE